SSSKSARRWPSVKLKHIATAYNYPIPPRRLRRHPASCRGGEAPPLPRPSPPHYRGGVHLRDDGAKGGVVHRRRPTSSRRSIHCLPRPAWVVHSRSALSRCFRIKLREHGFHVLAAALGTFMRALMHGDALDQFEFMTAVFAVVIVSGHLSLLA